MYAVPLLGLELFKYSFGIIIDGFEGCEQPQLKININIVITFIIFIVVQSPTKC